MIKDYLDKHNINANERLHSVSKFHNILLN
jgi:hypothetical protein